MFSFVLCSSDDGNRIEFRNAVVLMHPEDGKVQGKEIQQALPSFCYLALRKKPFSVQ
jgi:ATP-dependent protease ClpP protease subunit